MSKSVQILGDVAAGGLVAGAMANWLPTAAAVLGLVWYGIQIWESKTAAKFRFRIHRWWTVKDNRLEVIPYQQTGVNKDDEAKSSGPKPDQAA